MGKRYLFGKEKGESPMSIFVYMKSDYLGWDEMRYVDGRRHIDDVIMDVEKYIEIFYDSYDHEIEISSEEGSESFWWGYRNLIDKYYRQIKQPLPKFNRERKMLRKKHYKAGEKAIIDNWFIEIELHFYAECTVEYKPMDTPLFDYIFKFGSDINI